MSSDTAIGWTHITLPDGRTLRGATWNVMTGCTRISAGCDHCYADTLAQTRLADVYRAQLPVIDTAEHRADPFAPRFWEQRLDQPIRWQASRGIFVNSMSDVFHAHFSLEMIQRVFDIMARANWHIFLVLTKRPERALRLASQLPWPRNVWLGTTVEGPEVLKRMDSLRQIPASRRFISAEPLLGPLTDIDMSGIHWVIAGGESGPGFREFEPSWACSLRDSTLTQGAAFFWKQNGGLLPKSRGKLLEGVEWCQFPDPGFVLPVHSAKRST